MCVCVYVCAQGDRESVHVRACVRVHACVCVCVCVCAEVSVSTTNRIKDNKSS